MKKALFILATILVSCGPKKPLESRGIVFASMSRSGEINPNNGFPKFEVYCCENCNSQDSYNAKISSKIILVLDSITVFQKTNDTAQISRLEKRADILTAQWAEVCDSLYSFKERSEDCTLLKQYKP